MKKYFRETLSLIDQTIIGRYLGRLGKFLACELGYRRENDLSLSRSLSQLKRLGFAPNYTVDVGAYHGEWTTLVKSIFSDCQILMIEPQADKKLHLSQVKQSLGDSIHYFKGILGNSNGREVMFYEMESGSSILEENSGIPRSSRTLVTRTLDSVVDEFQFKPVDFLKLDVQGYELEVLKGALTTLSSVEVILMEVSLIPINEGAPLLHEVLPFMKSYGFAVYDICSIMRRPLDNALCQVDLIFIRENSKLITNTSYD